MSGNCRGAREPFIGRGAELRRLREWGREGGRLLTVRGSGGIGKSRLVWEFCRELGEGALHVDASGEPIAALARALGLDAAAAGDLGAALARRGRLLVILDDVVGSGIAAPLAGWLEAAPEASFLLTSREATGLPEEEILELGPLPVADEAVELLRLRAAAHGADLADVDPAVIRSIAAGLDGLPLALELAAAQLAHLPAQQLLDRLPARLELLVRTADSTTFSRHDSLREAIDASWEKLGPRERSALAQASVFRGGFDEAAAESVLVIENAAPLEAIRALRERSLVRVMEGKGGPRYCLDESVRIFAARQLGPPERAAVERRHAAHYLGWAERWAEAAEARTDLHAAAALERESENLHEIHRRVLARTTIPADAAADGLLAAVVLAPFYTLRQQVPQLLALLDKALEAASPSRTDPSLRARALLARGAARLNSSRPAGALADLLEAMGLARTAGLRLVEGRVLLMMSRVHREQGRDEESRRAIEKAIEILREVGADDWLGRALGSRGLLAHERGELEEARRWYEQAIEAHLRCGDRRAGAVIQGTLGTLLFDQGRGEEAKELIREAIGVFHELGDSSNEGALMGTLASIYQEAGAFERACAHYDEALLLLRLGGRRRTEALALAGKAGALLEAGHTAEAERTYETACATFREVGDTRNLGLTLLSVGILHAIESRLGEAEAKIDQAERLLGEVDDPRRQAALQAARGAVALARAWELRDAGREENARALWEDATRFLALAMEGGAATREDSRLQVRILEREIRRFQSGGQR